jgi:hypothetical protein
MYLHEVERVGQVPTPASSTPVAVLDQFDSATIPQGPFSNLWVPKPGDITMVA